MSDQEQHRTVHVYSDGNGATTRIILDDGTDITNFVSGLTLEMSAGEINKARLEFLKPTVDIDATIDGVEMECAICGFCSNHVCDRMKL